MTFHVGQKVVCVDSNDGDAPRNNEWSYIGGLDGLLKGRVYTVRGVVPFAGFLCESWGYCGAALYLCEIVRPQKGLDPCEPPFRMSRFQPFQESGMSILRAIAANPKQKVDA